ncbi:prion-like-(Q/N-rich) domain-bearing protein 25 [Ostrea edulis]|uniref:prion-like-(Q/N-rich) domain-bearing protein 25 n=1 Tax=Ostrea edulis TaxID=37623 RepID=UPI0024AF0CC5|nr:prion-like-(Q/N-rich) domain-bearing protein 25 [Ostrea edulis]
MLMLLINLFFSWLLLSQKCIVAEHYERRVAQYHVRYVFEEFRCSWSNLMSYLPESRSHSVGCYATIDYLSSHPAANHSLTIQLNSGSQTLTGSRSVKVCHLRETAVKLNFSCRISQTAQIDEWCFSNNDCEPRNSVCRVRNIYGQCACQNGTMLDRGKCLKRMGLREQCQNNEDCGVYNAHCKHNTCRCKNGYYEFHGNCIKENVSFA